MRHSANNAQSRKSYARRAHQTDRLNHRKPSRGGIRL